MGTKRNPSFSWHCDLLDYAFTPSCCQGRFCSHCAHSHLTSLTLPPIFTLNLNFRSKPKVCTYFVLGPDPYASLAP